MSGQSGERAAPKRLRLSYKLSEKNVRANTSVPSSLLVGPQPASEFAAEQASQAKAGNQSVEERKNVVPPSILENPSCSPQPITLTAPNNSHPAVTGRAPIVFNPDTGVRLKTQAAHDKAAQILGDGAAPHPLGQCARCLRRGDQCIVNPGIAGGNTCSCCARNKEKCSHQIVEDGKWIRQNGKPAENGPCTQCAEKASKGVPAECYQASSNAAWKYGTSCSQCQIDGTKGSCSMKENPKKRKARVLT